MLPVFIYMDNCYIYMAIAISITIVVHGIACNKIRLHHTMNNLR